VNQVFIKPNGGRNVRLESGLLLPVEGMEVAHTIYVERRILSGDAVVVEMPSVKTTKESNPKLRDRR